MNCKLTGTIKSFKTIADGAHELLISLAGKDQNGKEVGGEIKLNCSSPLLRGVKIQDILTIQIAGNSASE